MNQLSGMTLTTRRRAAFHQRELMPAQLMHRPTAAQQQLKHPGDEGAEYKTATAGIQYLSSVRW
jgi:hypothetical protein